MRTLCLLCLLLELTALVKYCPFSFLACCPFLDLKYVLLTAPTKMWMVIQHTYSKNTGSAEMVRLLQFWPDQFFLKYKNEIPFLQKASNKQKC